MNSEPAGAIDRFYALLDELSERIGGPRTLADKGISRRCPEAGLYFFFEPGETRPNGAPRVVRIGTHGLTPTSTSTLWGRLAQHRGSVGGSNPGGGNHRGSIFRLHVGSALLHQGGATDLLHTWRKRDRRPEYLVAERAVEVEVSAVIRAMPLLWLSVPTGADGTSERGALESNLIALISTVAGGTEAASEDWLGRHAAAPKIASSSLWNVQHLHATFDPVALDLLEQYVSGT